MNGETNTLITKNSKVSFENCSRIVTLKLNKYLTCPLNSAILEPYAGLAMKQKDYEAKQKPSRKRSVFSKDGGKDGLFQTLLLTTGIATDTLFDACSDEFFIKLEAELGSLLAM